MRHCQASTPLASLTPTLCQHVIFYEYVSLLLIHVQGSLRSALNQQRLVDPTSPVRLPAVHLALALAHDVACAMLHLHSEQIVHSDLKASNVLLTKGNTMDLSADAANLRRGSCAALLAAAQAAAGGRLVAKGGFSWGRIVSY